MVTTAAAVGMSVTRVATPDTAHPVRDLEVGSRPKHGLEGASCWPLEGPTPWRPRTVPTEAGLTDVLIEPPTGTYPASAANPPRHWNLRIPSRVLNDPGLIPTGQAAIGRTVIAKGPDGGRLFEGVIARVSPVAPSSAALLGA